MSRIFRFSSNISTFFFTSKGSTSSVVELTWVGKYEEEKLEPRILIEDKSKSYGDSNTENMLIHGDNLLALMALQSEFSGKVKCIYIVQKLKQRK